MGIVRTVLISTIDLRNPKSLCKNLSLREIKKLKFQYFPLYFWVHSLVKIKVQFGKEDGLASKSLENENCSARNFTEENI